MTDTPRILDPSVPGARELLSEGLALLRASRGGARLVAEMAIDAGVSDPSSLAAVLLADGRVLGVVADGVSCAVATLSTTAPHALTGVFVTPSHRRRGLALALVDHAARHHAVIDGWALPGDRATKSLYERAGWRARRLTMSAE